MDRIHQRLSAPFSAGASAMRSSRGRRRCSTRCCRVSRLISASPRPPICVPYSQRAEKVRLEIGFGGAEHLIEQARNNPRTGFIGSDAFINGVAKALAAIEEHKLANVRLHHGDASELLDWLPDAALTRIDLLYPDPWPKRRHWKRRFIQDDSLKRLARILKPGGELRFATRYCRLRGLRVGPRVTFAGFRVDGRMRRRLAQGLAGFFRHALRGQGQARRPYAGVYFDLSGGTRLSPPPPRCHGRTCQKRTTRWAVAGGQPVEILAPRRRASGPWASNRAARS